jgi:ABC-type enterochelin transport system permease subunit
MNRLHRFGTALFHVGVTGAFVSFVALMPFAQGGSDYLWVPLVGLIISGVIAGTGHVVAHTFDDPPQASDDLNEHPSSP